LWVKIASAGVVLGVVVSLRTSIQAPVATPVTHATRRVTPQRCRSAPYRPTLPRPCSGTERQPQTHQSNQRPHQRHRRARAGHVIEVTKTTDRQRN
jgi:hypothetical protein